MISRCRPAWHRDDSIEHQDPHQLLWVRPNNSLRMFQCRKTVSMLDQAEPLRVPSVPSCLKALICHASSHRLAFREILGRILGERVSISPWAEAQFLPGLKLSPSAAKPSLHLPSSTCPTNSYYFSLFRLEGIGAAAQGTENPPSRDYELFRQVRRRSPAASSEPGLFCPVSSRVQRQNPQLLRISVS